MRPGGWRVVIIDDDVLLTSALEIAFEHEAHATVVATAGSIAAGIDAVRAARPDVVLTDRRLPDGDVEDHISALVAAQPSARVVMMSGLPTKRSAVLALEGGVVGIVSKAQPLARIVDAIERVMAGELVIPASVAGIVVDRAQQGRRSHRPGDLSTRELDVLDALAHGESLTSIAERLSISRHTARNHLARVMLKLGVHDRLSAVTEGIRLGLVSSHHPQDLDAPGAGRAVGTAP